MATVEAIGTAELLAKVDELAPLMRAHAAEAERERRLPAQVAQALRDAGFFRMFRPQSRGGLGLDPVSEYTVAEAIARVDSAASWNVQIANAAELFGAWFADDASAEVFGSAESIVVGAFFPPRRAVAVEGGYRVSGTTTFNSGCRNATWILGLAHAYDGEEPRMGPDGTPTVLLTAIPTEDAEILDNWNTLGMRGTGSHDVRVTGLFVPEERAVPFLPLTTYPDAYDWPGARIAGWLANGSLGATALGVAQTAVDELVALGKKVPAYTENALRNRPVAQMRLAQAEGKLGAARCFLHDALGKAWDRAREPDAVTMAEKGRCQLAATHAVMAAGEAVNLVHSCVGASGIRNEQQFQRHFRDAHVITQHTFVCESRLEAVGQVMFGQEPDWPFFQF